MVKRLIPFSFYLLRPKYLRSCIYASFAQCFSAFPFMHVKYIWSLFSVIEFPALFCHPYLIDVRNMDPLKHRSTKKHSIEGRWHRAKSEMNSPKQTAASGLDGKYTFWQSARRLLALQLPLWHFLTRQAKIPFNHPLVHHLSGLQLQFLLWAFWAQSTKNYVSQ